MRSTPGGADVAGEPRLRIDGLRVAFATEFGTVDAVRGVTFDVRQAECLAVVGESGSGKSQLFMACLGLLAGNGSARGSARLDGEELIGATEESLQRVRGGRVALVSQDPMNALTPHMRIGAQLTEYVLERGLMSRADAKARALDLLLSVGIDDPAARLTQYPHELSGGQRQRVAIAMALMPGPALMIADEPTTALDVTVQAQVVDVMRRLRDGGLSIVFITHDLSVAAELADRVAVMYAGVVVELAPVHEIFTSPRHPYTRALLDSVPRVADAPGGRLRAIEGQPPRPHERLRGCPFSPRCPTVRETCRVEEPSLRWIGERACACHAPLAQECAP